jgi:2,4-dienoyl-CoA reductase-like NADH-dependent reductase (Old Yellow Enzyme family)/thioredoxin reductase
MTVKNRIVMAPMERNFANPDGTVSERTKAHYEARARGGVGWIDVESTFVDPVGRGRTHQLGLHEDFCIEGFRDLAEIAHAHGARIGVELHHAGRNTSRAVSGFQPVAPSPVPCPEAGGDVPHELSIEEIEAIIRRYGQAARRAAAAGFDAVELHSAHGYLPLAFLSPLTNLRTDEYGGSLENRMRFAVRVIAAFKEYVQKHVTIGCRFSADEFLPGGLNLEDTVQYARALESAGVDYLSVSAGVYASFKRIIPPMDVPSGWLLPAAAAIRAAVNIPVVGVSRMTDPREAERAITEGHVDLLAFGRALLADPEFPRKAEEDRFDEIVTCIGYNEACVSRIADQRDVTCLVNPTVGRERDFALRPAERKKTVLVVGGGPAGMEAARVAAERGHQVSLFERESELGGQARLAALLPYRQGWQIFVRDAARRVTRSGVRVHLGVEVGEDDLRAAGADAIILATGARFPLREIRGAAEGFVRDVLSLLASREVPGKHVVVVGDGAVGLGFAEWLAERGTRASVVTERPEVGDPEGQPGLLERLGANERIAIHVEQSVREVVDGAVVIARAGAIGPLFAEEIGAVDAIVLADQRRSSDGLAWLARKHRLAGEVYEIGDCDAPRNALDAVLDGSLVARRL